MTGYKEGDIVAIVQDGRTFLALVKETRAKIPMVPEHNLRVEPLNPNNTHFTASSREVVTFWRHGRGKVPGIVRPQGGTFRGIFFGKESAPVADVARPMPKHKNAPKAKPQPEPDTNVLDVEAASKRHAGYARAVREAAEKRQPKPKRQAKPKPKRVPASQLPARRV